jgi:acetyl esterase/lipase
MNINPFTRKPMFAGLVAVAVTSLTMTAHAQALKPITDIAYLPADRAEKLDVYLPANAKADAKLPVVIFIHGGGWAGGDKADTRSKNLARVLTDAGYVFVSINYQLAPAGQGSYHANLKASFPQNLKDCKAAVRFIRDNAAKYHADPQRIAVMGASAGAHLGALVAYTDPKDEFGDIAGKVQCFVGLYGIYDWGLFQKKNITTDADSELAKKASPLTYLDKDDPPTYAIHGTKDIHVRHDQTETLGAKLKELGVAHQVVIVPSAPHSFDFNLKLHDLKGDVLPFLAHHLKGGK